ncbi:protein wntless-like, partial [Ruditapes philippinarum]|uniref:protein wntless-like n=1 Tax=Ruditapes philippinarum TaxID=129788 RepID=UPI00295B021C
MAGVVLETLSWKKLIILGLLLLFLLISFFLIGGLIAPNPSNVINVLGTICKNEGGIGNKEWVYTLEVVTRKCIQYDNLDVPGIEDDRTSANQIVFAFWMPHVREGKQLDFSRWQQTMIGVLQLDIIYDEKVEVEEDATIQLDARIGYRNKDDDVNDWKELAKSLEERNLNCKMEGKKENGYAYDCDPLSFFELGSVHHDYYLVNIKVPVEPYKGINMGIGKLRDITLV